MDSNNWLNYIPLFLSLAITVGVGIYAWRHRHSPGIMTFVLVMLAEIFWIIGYIFELASPGIDAKIFWDNVQFIGSMGVPLALLIFAYEYTGLQKELTNRVRIVLAIIPVFFLILLFTNSWHGIVRDSSAWIEPGQPFDTLLYDFTVPMWVSFVYSYVGYLSATILFIRNLMRQHRLFRVQTAIIVTGFVFPFLGSIQGLRGAAGLGLGLLQRLRLRVQSCLGCICHFALGGRFLRSLLARSVEQDEFLGRFLGGLVCGGCGIRI